MNLLGSLSDLFQGLSDPHLGDQKVTWKKLADLFLLACRDFLPEKPSTGQQMFGL